MRVAELWRYPVKSLQGERLERALLTADGVEGDRRYAIFDLETGLGLTGRREPELLFASASSEEDGSVRITLPDGSVAAGDEPLSEWLGRPVQLRSSDHETMRRYENVVDFEHEQSSEWNAFEGSPGPFHDSSAARVSLVTTTTIGGWDRRRFRPNVLLEGAGEDDLVGTRVAVGEASLDIVGRLQRCVMVTRPQPGGLDRDLEVLRTIARERNTCLAVGGLVIRGGVVRVGDASSYLTCWSNQASVRLQPSAAAAAL